MALPTKVDFNTFVIDKDNKLSTHPAEFNTQNIILPHVYDPGKHYIPNKPNVTL